MTDADPIQEFRFQNQKLSLADRVDDLMSHLTLSEKLSLLHQYQPAIPRLGLQPFKTGAEALHGVAWLGEATVFPQAIGLGSTWSRSLVQQIGSAVGDEVRGYHFKDRYLHSLNVWAPAVDPLRDPHAGRNEEGYAEDPYLIGQMSLAYTAGLRGDDPFYLKTAPTIKHFFAYNHEQERDTSDVFVDARNLHEYYLKGFQPAIAAGNATGVMTSYNLVNGRPTTLSPLINKILRQWADLSLFVVSDAVAPSNLVRSQKYYETAPEALAAALKAGIDSFTDHDDDPAPTLDALQIALENGLIREDDVDTAVGHVLSLRFRLGEFDSDHPYAGITDAVIHNPEHQTLALEAARQQMVLLKNEAEMLPLDKKKITRLALIGQRADEVLTDWYSGTLPIIDTPLAAIRRLVGDNVTVEYAADNRDGMATKLAGEADVVIVMVGNHPTCNAGWAECNDPSEGKEAVDRQSLALPTEPLIQALYAVNPKTIVVLISSFPYSINWTNDNVPAILWSSHAGQGLGQAMAEVLFGEVAPAGRLCQTWYASADDVPHILDYDIIKQERTYLYFAGKPLYPFGHGLTYTNFVYANLRISADRIDQFDELIIWLDLANIGNRVSDEVVQLYIHVQRPRVKRPRLELKGFERVTLAPGETQTIQFKLAATDLAFWDVTQQKWTVEHGLYDLLVGRSSADIRLAKTFMIEGEHIPHRDLRQQTEAEHFDDYRGIQLVDESKVEGTAVASTQVKGWILFKTADFGIGVKQIRSTVANSTPESHHLEVRLGSPNGALAGRVMIPPTEHKYSWVTLTTPIEEIAGRHDLYLVFDGPFRLSRFVFEN